MNLTVFDDRRTASIAAAQLLAASLKLSLGRHARPGFVVSGGQSPRDCLIALSELELDWARVDVVLTDEREVAATHEASNSAMVRSTLLQGPAASASLLACSAESLLTLGPIAGALVGMGEDGHFASIFPDLPEIDKLLDSDQPPGFHRVATKSSEYERVTANLSLLLMADQIVLLIFGQAKRKVIDIPDGLPIARLIENDTVPVQVCWAP